MMKIEKTEIWIELEDKLYIHDGRGIRGFFGNIYKNRPEFHGHNGQKFIYKHPLIQYKIIEGRILIIGIKEGAYLLKAINTNKYIELHHKKYKIKKRIRNDKYSLFGCKEDIFCYKFYTPWVALNEKNFTKYLKIKKTKNRTNNLLRKILIGNIISMSKSIGYVVDKQIYVSINIEENELIEVKNGVRLLSFYGEFKTNFIIPNLWGIGKFSSRGYGTVIELEENINE